MATGELNDLTPESTTEEVHQYVEQVVQEVEAERAEKSDAQITSEHADTPVPSKTEDEKTAPAKKDKGETQAKAETGQTESWMDDKVKAEAAVFGIEESDLEDFASREEYDRAMRLFSKHSQQEEAPPDKGSQEDQPPEDKEIKDGRYEIGLSTEEYDDDLVAEFGRLRDHYESRLEALESRLLESDAQAEQQQFDRMVDSLDHPELFGKTGDESEDELKRRQELFIASKSQQAGLEKLGRSADFDVNLIGVMAKGLFSEELTKKQLKSHTRRIQRQANSRQGGGATRPPDPSEDPREEADRLYKELGG